MNILKDELKKYNRNYSSSKAPVINRRNTVTKHISQFRLNILIGILCLFGKAFGGFACLSNPCIFGVCIDDLNSTYSCYCIDGYTGIQCQTNWDECWSSPCENGGSCIDGVAHYNCSCPEGFVGQNCEENLDECLSNPCQNGGLCHDKDNGYICTCMPGYLGKHCENDVAVCDTGKGTRCQNGGECTEGRGLEFSCKCLPGWEGQYCDEEIDECASAPCQNGGVCIDKLANYACACSMGYTGVNCEESVLVCEDSPCENSALCLMEEGQPVCYCVPDFHGEKCEYQYDECQLGPRCTNGGTCIDGVDDFSCSCPTSLTGILCECLILSNGDLDCNYTRTDLPMTTMVYPQFDNKTTDITMFTTIVSTTLDDELSTILLPSKPTTDSTTSKTESTQTTFIVPITSTIIATTTIEPTTYEYSTEVITTSIKDDTTTEMSSTNTQSTINQSTTDDIITTITEQTIPPTKIDTTTEITDNDNQKTTTTSSSTIINTTYSSTFDDTTTSIFSTTSSYITTPETSETETLSTTEKFKSTTFSTIIPFFTESPETKTTTEETITTTTIKPVSSTETLTTTEKATTATTETMPPPTTEGFTTTFTPSPSSSSETTFYTTYDLENSTGSIDCTKIPCYNGGTCVNTSEGSRCVCRFDRQGPLCESPVIIRNAAFAGDSYLSHRIQNKFDNIDPTIESELSMKIEVKGRTRATDGLILLAAAQGNRGGHYLALFLHRGLLQFQFSCGLQTMLLSELEAPVNTGDEMLIQAELDFSRNNSHCNASLRVNDTLAMSGDQPTWLSLQSFEHHAEKSIENTWLHLGGAPQAPFGLMSDLPAGQGFTGCLHNLKVNGKTREIFSNALDGFGITECGSLACLSNPCRNGAICIEEDNVENDNSNNSNNNNNNNNNNNSNNNDKDDKRKQKKQRKNDKWKCKCPTGYMGITCEISVCDNNPCQYGGTCVTFPGSGYLCLCPLGKHGHYCEHNMEVAQPSFSGSVKGLSSYVAYPVPVPLEYTMELSFKISPTTISQIALLAFLGQTGYHDDKSDHLAISFIQGYIMLTWNLGGGPRRIFIQKPIELRNDAQSHEIKIGRTGRKAWLSVDGKTNITGRSPGEFARLDVMPLLYLGGHEHANFSTLPHDLPLHSGFQGCIYDVQLKAGLVSVPLQDTKGVRGRGVGQCGTRECHRYACQHEGACLQYGATFTCICQEGWFGPLCAQQTHVCDSSNNQCSADSFCVPLVNSYECDCPAGKIGRNCDYQIKSLSDVSMSGRRSFLSINWPSNDKTTSSFSENEISHASRYQHHRKAPIKRFHAVDLLRPRTISNSILFKFVNENDKPIKNNTIESPPSLPQTMILKTIDQNDRVQYFSIELQVRPLSERGILIFFGAFDENNDKSVGFVSLSLQGGVVEFRIGGPQNQISIVRSSRILAIGEWHKIKMSQNGKRLTLWVEGSTTQTILPSGFVFLNQEEIIYVGGLPDLSKLPYNAVSGFPIPFRGCVRQLSVNGNRVVLNETNILESRNILDCDGTACGGDTCDLGGHCWLDEKLQPHCKCPQSAKGQRCEVPESCNIISCKNGGRCSASGDCSCPNGWGGFYCEIATSKYSTPSFRGNSYLIIPPTRIPQKDKRAGPSLYVKPQEFVQVAIKFSTIHPDGLLLWSSKQDTKFLGIGIENGHIKLASSLLGINNSTVDVPAGGFVSDGGWHTVQIEVDKNLIVLSVNGRTIFSEKRRNLNINKMDENQYVTMEDIFYIGGVPKTESIQRLTRNKFKTPFTGCLQDVTFGSEPKLQIDDFTTYEGENIGACELYDEFINN